MKKIFKLSIIFILALLVISCNNLLTEDFSDNGKTNGKVVITGTYWAETPRTAIPDPDLSSYYVEVVADSLDTPPAASVNGVADSVHHSYSIELTDGEWKIIITVYKDAAKTEKTLYGETTLTIADCGISSGTTNCSLAMFQTAASCNAEVQLPIMIPAEITRVEATWKETGVEKKQTVIQNNSSAATVYFTMINDGEVSLSATNGHYDVMLRFYQKIGTNEVIACTFVESINLYDYLTTNKWISNISSTLIQDGILVITSNIIKSYDREIFYVSSTGDDKTNSGGFFDPFATPQPAVDIIQTKGDWDTEYTIYVMDTVTMPSTSVGVDGSMVCIGDSSDPTVAPKITICGYQDDPQCKLDANSAFTYSRVMTIYKGAEVTLGNNLTIQNGVADLGAGIRNYGTLTVDGTSITNNAASSQGGGIYTSDGTVTFNSGSIVNNTAATGGAAMYTANSNVVFSNGIINNSIYIEGVTLGGAGKLEFTSNVRIGAILQFAYNPAGFVPVNMHGLVQSTQVIKAAFVPAAGKTYSDLIGTVFFQGENAGDAFEYPTNVKICTMDGTEVSGYSIDADGKLCGPAIVTPVNGGNNTSSYTVISSIAACGDTAPSTPGVYSLSTETELKKISDWVNGATETGMATIFEGYTFVLYDNIPLTSSWTPIGTYTDSSNWKGFAGTLDGNGNSITGIDTGDTYAGNKRIGFINVATNAVVKNLSLEGTIKANGYASGFIGYSYGSLLIDNCVNEVSVTATGDGNTGGFVGYATGNTSDKKDVQIVNCINRAQISGYSSVGGLLGGTSSAVKTLEIYNCMNDGDVTGSSNQVGGLVGYTGLTSNGLFIKNCISLKPVTGSSDAGPIVGKLGGNSNTFAYFNYSYYLDSLGTSPIGSSAATYTPESYIYSFTADGTKFKLSSGSDLVAALNNWIDDSSETSAITFTQLRKWKYSGSGVLDFVAEGDTPAVPANVADLGAAPTSGSYTLSSPAEFTQISSWVNAGNEMDGVTFVLTQPTDISGTWTPIGGTFKEGGVDVEKPFKGTFDGGGYEIKLDTIQSSSDNVGLFGLVEDATVKNVVVKSSVTVSTYYDGGIEYTVSNVGGIIGCGKGILTIENCVMNGTISANRSANVGGIIGYVDAGPTDNIVIRNCANMQGINADTCVGGIVGYCSENSASVSIENCSNKGMITANSYCGGIVGYSRNINTSIRNCVMQNTCTGSSDYGQIGGYIYGSDTSLIKNLYVLDATETAAFFGTAPFVSTSGKYYGIVLDAGTDKKSKTVTTNSDVVELMNNWASSQNLLNTGRYKEWQYELDQGSGTYDGKFGLKLE